jgi:hypothetical protein
VKRICLLGAAIAGLFIIGVASAMAASPHASTQATAGKKKSTMPTLATTRLSCTAALSLQVASGDTSVTQGATEGTEWGTTKCPNTLGSGSELQSFTTDDAGNLAGKWQAWFNAGSVYGTYTLAPTYDNPPTTSSFTAASYTGTVTIKAGTGADAKATGSGTLACATEDSVHFTCIEKAKLTLPAPTPSTKTKRKS